MAVIALIPAHNEEEQIRATLESLFSQTVKPTQILVMADNCTDRTVEVAGEAGATPLVTIRNKAKKAGALNQGLRLILPVLDHDDYVLLMDADSILCEDWIEKARDYLERDSGLGAVSGAYVARKGKGLVTLMQRAEYAQERRRISRRGGRVDVLSGTAVLVSVAVLKHLYEDRGFIYDESSLTEDFEFTLALQQLGYYPHCYRDLRVVTDVMETWRDLARQRIRWQRGTIETLRSYGWNTLTRRLWFNQFLTYGSTAITLLVIAAWSMVALLGAKPDLRWLLILPIFSLEQFVSSRRAGWAPATLAASLLPMWFYDAFRVTIYWVALGRSLRRTTATWA